MGKLIIGSCMVMAGLCAAAAIGAEAAGATAPPRYTFSWPVGPQAPAPRGGTTRGAPVEVVAGPTVEWQALQQPGLSAQERDRRAILAMAGTYRVTFDFLEVANYAGGERPRPYQSWGTEKIYVDRNEPDHVSLVHILAMRMVGEDGRISEPMITRHWRQDWHFEPEHLIEHADGDSWTRRALSPAQRQGQWSQTVYQVDESPRYGSVGRWEHNASFSTWIGNDTARPLPRREWSVRKDYQLLHGSNRHTVLPRGWLHEENNLKQAVGDAPLPYVGREYGVARYERIAADGFEPADRYYAATRAYWDAVREVWEEVWTQNARVQVEANSDQSGAFAGLFELAEEFGNGRLALDAAKPRIRAALAAQGIALAQDR